MLEKKDKKSIRNDVIAALIATLIIFLAGSIWLFVPQLFNWIVGFLANIWNYFVSDITIPNYLFWIFILISSYALLRFFYSVYKNIQSNEPTLRMYNEDEFFDIIWRWENPFDLYNLRGYCKRCDTMVVYSESKSFRDPTFTTYYCETCQREVKKFDGNIDYVLAMVARQIDRKIRNGEWKQLVSEKNKQFLELND